MRNSRRLAAACAFSTLVALIPGAAAYAAPTPPQPSPAPASEGRTIVDRTETSTTYSLAEGGTLTELHVSPIRVKKPGGWADIDTNLIEDNGVVRPKVAKGDVRFSPGGKGFFAQLQSGPGKTVQLGWGSELPKPVIEGNKAIYRGVAAGGVGDLVATALPTGLRFDVVLNRRPTGPVEVKVPVTGEGLTVGGAADGRVTIKDGATVIASSSKPVLYDAASPLAYKPDDKRRPRGAISGPHRTGAIAAVVKDTGSGTTLTLKPSADFLADPKTAYPVTIDPSVVLPLNDDTDVNSVFDGNNVSGGYLKAGTEADCEKARTYLRFDTRGLKPPTKALLKLTNLDAPACGPTVSAGVQVRRITGHWDAKTQTWTPQPTNTTEDAVVSTEGSQLGFCGSGIMTWDVTPIVAKWAAGTANHGLVLQSPTEAAQANYRLFASAENTDGLDAPVLEVTSDEVITPGEGDDPADPGPADFKPGRVDVDTGVWITSGTDLVEDGLITTRSHSAGQRPDITQPNENVLGPNWRLEPLGGMLGDRLKDYSTNGYIQINRTTGTESLRFLADTAKPGTFTAEDGSTVVRNPDNTFTQRMANTSLVNTWGLVGAEYLIIAVGDTENGTQTVTYDGQGRVSVLASPATPQDTCAPTGSPACASATFRYAQTTTATASQFGDVVGQLKEISYDAAGETTPVTVVSYAYDGLKRLRTVEDRRQIDGAPIMTSSYTYDAAGNITHLSTPDEGAWNLTYEAPGKLTTATKETTPASLALPAHCKYASQYMFGQDGCWAGPVPMSYGGTPLRPMWKKTPGNKSVVGVNDDHCTTSPDIPKGVFDFRAACDSHDYGYGIIYLSRTDSWNKSKKGAVDAVFYTILKDYTCNAYSNSKKMYPSWTYRQVCRQEAYSYYRGVSVMGGILM